MMKHFNLNAYPRFLIFSLIIFSFFTGCNQASTVDENSHNSVISNSENNKNEEIAVSRPPFSDEYIFPCTECHTDMEINTQERKLDMHEEIVESYNHDSENRWCLACHDANSRDSLRLASGKLLNFKESYKLCGQCHGDKFRDWKAGIHGKRTGNWNGKKEYLLCVHCHNPHSPRFKKIAPLPPPIFEGSLPTEHTKTEE